MRISRVFIGASCYYKAQRITTNPTPFSHLSRMFTVVVTGYWLLFEGTEQKEDKGRAAKVAFV